jgi:hypothetical protein
MKVTREEMVDRICAYRPCHGRAAVAGWMAAAPERVSARDVVRDSAGVVSDLDRLWVAFRLAPRPVRDFVVRRAVMRAIGHAADTLDRHGRPHTLRALTAATPYPQVRAAAAATTAVTAAANAATAAYAAANAAYAANANADIGDFAAATYASAAATYAADAAYAAANAATAATYAADARANERRLQLNDFLTGKQGALP